MLARNRAKHLCHHGGRDTTERRKALELANSTVELVHDHGYILAHIVRDGVGEWTKPQPDANVRALREVAHASE